MYLVQGLVLFVVHSGRNEVVPEYNNCMCLPHYVEMAHPAPPTITNFRITFLITQLLGALYEDFYLYRASNLEAEVSFWTLLKTVVSCNLFIIRECSSTLYVGLALAVPPTNTNFRLTFLLT